MNGLFTRPFDDFGCLQLSSIFLLPSEVVIILLRIKTIVQVDWWLQDCLSSQCSSFYSAFHHHKYLLMAIAACWSIRYNILVEDSRLRLLWINNFRPITCSNTILVHTLHLINQLFKETIHYLSEPGRLRGKNKNTKWCHRNSGTSGVPFINYVMLGKFPIMIYI